MSYKPNSEDRFDILVAETMGTSPDPKRIGIIYPCSFQPGHPSGEPHVTYCWSGFSVSFESTFVAVPLSWLDNSNKYDVLEGVPVEPDLWRCPNSAPLATCRVRRAEKDEIAADLNRRSIERLTKELRAARTSHDVAEKEFIQACERYEQIRAEYDAACRVDASSRPLGFENPPPPESDTTTEEQPNGNANSSGQD